MHSTTTPVHTHRTTRFWDRIADRYSKKPVPDENVYQRKLDITRTLFNPEMQVLEIGCGTGSTAIAHAPFVQHIRATDLSGRMIEIAQDKAKSGGVDNVTFEQAAVEDLNLADESLDAVLALSLLHLVVDRDAVIGDVYQALKPGGVFITSTACIGDMMWLFRLILPVMKLLRLAPLVKVFSSAELRRSLTNAGFTIEHDWLPGKGQALFLVARKPVV